MVIFARESYNIYSLLVMKYLKWTLAILLIVVLTLVGFNYRKLNIISGYAAKNMASTVFIAGRSPASVNENDHQVPLIDLATTREAADHRSAVTRVFGLMERKAICTGGVGCALVPLGGEQRDTTLRPHRFPAKDSLYFPYGDRDPEDTIFPEIDYAKLEGAVDQAFLNNDTQRTRTLLIAYKDHIVAERYGEGFDKDTPVLGWSMTKSILATLYGILQQAGKIDVMKPAPVPGWQGDERKEITLDNLLRMQSGLAWDEDYTSISDVTRMLFMEADMSRVQLEKKAVARPGEIWNYSSGTTNLLSGILRSCFENDQEYLDFPYKALIDKVGMHSMILETDMAGNFVGSSYGWASTRDWAKFGLLYLHQGQWNGEQIFDPGWVTYVTRPTAHSNGRYGAHFWLNRGGIYPGVPKDLFSANGYQGQYVFIIPSKNLVVVRTGLAEAPDFDIDRFLRKVVDAIP